MLATYGVISIRFDEAAFKLTQRYGNASIGALSVCLSLAVYLLEHFLGYRASFINVSAEI